MASMRNALSRLGLVATEPEEYAYQYEDGDEQLADVTPINREVAPMAPGSMHRIVTARPRTYNGDAKMVGTPYREGIPVIMNLSDVASDADSQRFVDFAAGLTYALHGKLERITAGVFLLSPASIDVTAAGRGTSNGYFDGE